MRIIVKFYELHAQVSNFMNALSNIIIKHSNLLVNAILLSLNIVIIYN